MSDLSTANTGPVDVEAIAVAVLREDAGVVAFLAELDLTDAGQHVGTELPADRPLPRLQPSHAGGVAVDPLGRINRARLTLNAWGPPGDVGKGQAFDLITVGMVALHRIAGDAFPQGVVTEVRTIGLPTWAPEDRTDLARYRGTLEVYAHRTAVVGPGSGA